jgi:hypothetical protein
MELQDQHQEDILQVVEQLEHMMLIQDQLYQVEQVVVDQHLDQMVLLH